MPITYFGTITGIVLYTRSYNTKGQLNGLQYGYDYDNPHQIRYLMNYKNNVLEGKQKMYYKNGQLQYELHYKNGKQCGSQTRWDKNGQVIYNKFY